MGPCKNRWELRQFGTKFVWVWSRLLVSSSVTRASLPWLPKLGEEVLLQAAKESAGRAYPPPRIHWECLQPNTPTRQRRPF